MKRLLALLLTLAMCCVLASCGTASKDTGGGGTEAPPQDKTAAPEEKSYTLKLGTVVASTNSLNVVLEEYAKRVHERTDGTITIEIYPNSQLGSALQQIEGVRLGSQDMYADGLSWFQDYKGMENLRIIGMPGVFVSNEHVVAFFESEKGLQLWDTLENSYNIKVLTTSWGRVPSGWMLKTPVHTPDDWKGLKLRVPEQQIWSLSYKYLGASPVPIAWADTYSSIQQGMVDGVDGPPNLMYNMSFQEVTNCLIMSRHFYNQAGPIVNAQLFEGMSERQQAALVDCANELGEMHTTMAYEEQDTQVEDLKANGYEVTDLTTEEQQTLFGPLYTDEFKAMVEDPESGLWEAGLIDYVKGLTP